MPFDDMKTLPAPNATPTTLGAPASLPVSSSNAKEPAGCRRSQLLFLITILGIGIPFVTAHAVEPGKEILLWPNGAPGSEGNTGEMKVRIAERGERVLSNIHKPSLTPYLPAADKATGCAVIVAPG